MGWVASRGSTALLPVATHRFLTTFFASVNLNRFLKGKELAELATGPTTATSPLKSKSSSKPHQDLSMKNQKSGEPATSPSANPHHPAPPAFPRFRRLRYLRCLLFNHAHLWIFCPSRGSTFIRQPSTLCCRPDTFRHVIHDNSTSPRSPEAAEQLASVQGICPPLFQMRTCFNDCSIPVSIVSDYNITC